MPLPHRRVTIVALLVLAAALRLIVFHQLSGGPIRAIGAWDQSDMNFFDGWARDVASGDWLSRAVHPPLHSWHRRLAEDYLGRNPGMTAALKNEGDPVQAVWNRWIGTTSFYQEPLYPYLVALTYRAGAAGPGGVLAGQLLAGIVATIFVYLITRRFGPRAAVAAAAIAVVYAPFLYLENLLLRDSLIVLATLGLVLVAEWVRANPRRERVLGFGFASGLAILLKSHFALFLAGMMVIVAAGARRDRRRAAALVLVMAAGAAIALTPLMIRNAAVGAPLLRTSSMGLMNFASGNVYDPGLRRDPAFLDRLGRVAPAAGEGVLPAVRATLATYPSAGAVIAQIGTKIARTFSAYEEPDNANFYYAGLHSDVLRHLPGRFVLVAPLGLVGLALTRRGAGRDVPLHLALAVSLAVPLFLYPWDRLRAPLAATLIPFAGLAIVRIGDWIARRDIRRAIAAGAAVILLALLVSWHRPDTPIRAIDYMVGSDYFYLPRAEQALQRNDVDGAAAMVREDLALEPANLTARPESAEGAMIARYFGELNAGMAAMMRQYGRAAEASRYEARSAALRQAAASWRGGS